MSGIVGIYCLDDRPVDRQDLEKMVDVLLHRGPDGADIWIDGSVGFGHRMLWTTPESLFEKLPLIKNDLIITADARIDNRNELKLALNLPDRPLEKISDSEFILAAYEKWGEDCPKHLLGDFAFAIWNKREQKLFCARDHFGVKPFYYHYQTGQGFFFASEIKALLCLSQVPRRLNEVAIADYLHPFTEDKSITSYQDVFRLPPGHIMIVENTSLKLRSYWSLELGDELQLDSDQEYADAFREVFTEAVRCRLRSAFPISSHLSGGLDSSSVTCVARRILQERGSQLHTFSNIFDNVPECDERPFINAVLEQGGCIPHYVHADRYGPLTEWQQFFQYEDEAFIGPSHFLTWSLSRAIQEAGIRIALDGFDGDTTVSHGANYFAELVRQGNWKTFIAEANAVSKHFDTSLAAILRYYGFAYLEKLAQQWKWIAFAKTATQISKHFKVSRKKLFLYHGIKPLTVQLKQTWRSLRKGIEPQSSITMLINAGFIQQIKLSQKIQFQNPPQSSLMSVREEQWHTLTSALFVSTLEQIDRFSAAFSIESRHPFMDKRVVEFCLSLPPQQRLNQGWSRMVMRRAVNGIIPEKIQWRGGKTTMTPNFLRGLLETDRELLQEIVIDNQKDIEDFVDLNSLNLLYQNLMSKQKEEITNDDVTPVWKALTLVLWLRHTKIKP
jgi:asparagine synthase (glutamine-hydrolysing)